MAASSTSPADAAVGTQRKGEGTEDTAYWVQILPSHSFMATTSQTKPQYAGPFVGTKRKCEEAEDTDYDGMADKLDDPIPCVHFTKGLLAQDGPVSSVDRGRCGKIALFVAAAVALMVIQRLALLTSYRVPTGTRPPLPRMLRSLLASCDAWHGAPETQTKHSFPRAWARAKCPKA